jgi:hypothetical protein
MDDNNLSYKKTNNDMYQDIDTSAKDDAMEAIQKKKEMYEQLKREAEEAQQANEEFHQQMREESMLGSGEGFNINEFGEIERSPRSK